MRRMMFCALACAMCMVVEYGCNIKEDRSECPCRLNLNIEGVRMEEDDSLELYVSSGEGMVYSTKLGSEEVDATLVMDVPRTSLKLMAWCGGEGMTVRNGLVIPLGKQCPKVYVYTAEVDASGETCSDTVTMRKNHCVLSVLFKDDNVGDVGLSLSGNVCGYDESGTPIVGEFYADIIEDVSVSVGCPQVVIPRQCGGEMTLHVNEGTERVRSFPLAEYIVAAGYDWSAPDLPDMIVTIDYVQTIIRLEIPGWDEEFYFDIVI